MDQAEAKPAEKNSADFAKVVLVPLANPDTARALLGLAASLVDVDGGKIIALHVSVGDPEKDADTVEKLTALVEEIAEERPFPLSFKTVNAPSVSRGILDEARQSGSDLLVQGLLQNKRGEVVLGSVVENVIETAPCDVLIYRMGRHKEFNRIVIPVEDERPTRVAADIALHIRSQEDNCRIEAMRVQPSSKSHFEGLAAIESAISELDGSRQIKRTVINAADAEQAILSRTDDDDLLVVGFSARSDFERQMFGDLTQSVLQKAEGPVIMVYRSLQKESRTDRMFRRFVSWIRPTLTRVEQEDIVRLADSNSRLNIDYVVLILVSAVIASLGLLLNSSAVIIGAMLVAPLMSPLISLSTGLTVGRVRIAWRALFSVVVGMILALIASYVMGILLPRLPTEEMVGRGTPTILDAAVALASGAIGAYATARKDIPAALAGVAIAAALMPPLCTVALGVAVGEQTLAFGALVLFLTNILCIIFAGIAVFLYMGMTFRRYEDVSVRLQLISVILLVMVAVPIAAELFDLSQQVSTENIVRREVRDQLPQGAELIDLEFFRSDPLRIVATIRTPEELTQADFEHLETSIVTQLGESVRLDLVFMNLVRLDLEPEETPEPPSSD